MVRDLKGVMEREAATKVSGHDARRWAALLFLSRTGAKARRKGERQFPYLLLCGFAPLCDKFGCSGGRSDHF
jgi:hypothetical protein